MIAAFRDKGLADLGYRQAAFTFRRFSLRERLRRTG
jgi:hypothetical protein